MKLSDAIAAESISHGPKCTIATLMAALPADDRKTLAAALEDQSIANTVISRALKTIGHAVRANTISRHRKRECNCDK